MKIAIIDSGVASHSDLTIAGGKNVISDSSSSSYVDENGHGTHVAGIITAQNGGVKKGIAPYASIYAVKTLDSDGEGYTSDIISGIDWAIQNDTDIISMSLGSYESSTVFKNAIDTVYNDSSHSNSKCNSLNLYFK
ncbi:S8 family serine peptidase [Clostridium sp.]|uniref:S8 family serine peptidase n=1 Tax=Clostridium sp. TaxID=1506 RepID=UPI002FDDD150